MFDLEYLKRRCAEYSTDDLLRCIYLETEEFIPDAIKIFKDEIERREGEIKQLITREAIRSGSIDFTLRASVLSSKENIEAIGNAYLTSKGLFFIPDKIVKNSSFPYGAGAAEAGLFGLILDEIILSLATKEVSLKIKKELPPSMLASILPNSLYIAINEIKYVAYSSTGRIQVENYNGEKEIVHITSELQSFLSWLNLHNIPNSKRTSPWSKFFHFLFRGMHHIR